MSRDRDASEKAIQDIRHIPAEGRKPCRAVLRWGYRHIGRTLRRCVGSGIPHREERRAPERSLFFLYRFQIFLLTLWQSRDIITKLTSDSIQFLKVLQKTSKNLLTERSKNDMITLVADTAAPQNSILSDVSEILQKDFKKNI